jgi:hypothetical protein
MIHRLNRAEYANAIRDLRAEVDAAALLPPDDSANGFDNIADVLSLRPRCSKATCRQRKTGRSPWVVRRSQPIPKPTRSVAMAQTEHPRMPLGTRVAFPRAILPLTASTSSG